MSHIDKHDMDYNYTNANTNTFKRNMNQTTNYTDTQEPPTQATTLCGKCHTAQVRSDIKNVNVNGIDHNYNQPGHQRTRICTNKEKRSDSSYSITPTASYKNEHEKDEKNVHLFDNTATADCHKKEIKFKNTV